MARIIGYVAIKYNEPQVRQALVGNPGYEWVAGFGDATWRIVGVKNPNLLNLARNLEAQGSTLVRVLPAMSRTFVNLPAAKKAWLESHGVTFQPGDSMYDIMVKLTGDEDFGMEQ